MANPGGALEIGTKTCSAVVSKSPKEALSKVAVEINFLPTRAFISKKLPRYNLENNFKD